MEFQDARSLRARKSVLPTERQLTAGSNHWPAREPEVTWAMIVRMIEESGGCKCDTTSVLLKSQTDAVPINITDSR